MYKIIDRNGHQIGKEFDNVRDALDQIKRFRYSRLRVIVVDSSTRILNKGYAKVPKKRIGIRPFHLTKKLTVST